MQGFKRLCFLHIPKTAGTSIRSILANWYPQQTIFSGGNKPEFDSLDRNQLAEYWLFHGHVTLMYAKSQLPDDTFYVTLLREPVERLVSLYYFWEGHSDDYLNNPDIDEYAKIGPSAAKRFGIVEFFSRDDLHKQILKETRNGQLHYLSAINKSLMGNEDDSALIQQALENMRLISIVGVQCQLPFFVYELKKLLGISEPVMLPQTNVSKRSKRYSKLSDKDRNTLISIISQHNSAEIEVYKKIELNVKCRMRIFFKNMVNQPE